MEFINSLIDLFLHLDEHLATIISQYGTLTYLLLFTVVFMETGLVVTPFLPGDSLLFAAGTFASPALNSPLNIWILFVLLLSAAILGDSVNYWVGSRIGLTLFRTQNPLLRRVLKEEYLVKTGAFYARHGGKTIVLARFVPIIRTFAPFVAGVGSMNYRYFLAYNILGAFLWISLFLLAGYLFGNIPFVKENFEYVVLAIIGISLLPMIYEFFHGHLMIRKKPIS